MDLPLPFNLAAHDVLMAAGYKYERVPGEWADVGDAENGPDLVGHDDFDKYTSHEDYVYVGFAGDTGFEFRDHEFEAAMLDYQGPG